VAIFPHTERYFDEREKFSLSPLEERVGKRGRERRREGPWGIPLSGVAPEGNRVVVGNTFTG
jgi:hypothetical protein